MKNKELGLVLCDGIEGGGVWGSGTEPYKKEGEYVYMWLIHLFANSKN